MKVRLLLSTLLLATACSDGNDTSNTPGSPDGGNLPAQGGGVSATGGSTAATGGMGGSGGTATGGMGGSGGTATGGSGGEPLFDPAEHCSPGEYFEAGHIFADPAFGGIARECWGESHQQAMDNGLGEDAFGVTSITLPVSMQPGTPSGISWEMELIGNDHSSFTMEYWAASSECGISGPLERFYIDEDPQTRVHCGSITPALAFTHILLVRRQSPNPDARGGSTRRGVTVCTAGTCPSP
jgi:hypothetical protein